MNYAKKSRNEKEADERINSIDYHAAHNFAEIISKLNIYDRPTTVTNNY